MSDVHQRPPRSPLVPPGGLDLHARDMTATFSADLTLEQAQLSLAAIGHWMPIDGEPSQTLGRLIDFNSTGPLRLGYGAWRDLLLGVQFVDDRYELITAGGKTVKNVAGYDLTKFMVGQHGSFGRLLTLTTRTYRRPDAALLATFPAVVDRVGQLLPSPLKPQWMLMTSESLQCGYLGDERTIAFYRAQVAAAGGTATDHTLEADIEHRASVWPARGVMTFRASVPPARVMDILKRPLASQAVADPAFGIVVGSIEPSEVDSLRSAVESLAGNLKIFDFRSEPPLVSLQPPTPIEAELIRRLQNSSGRAS